MAKILSLLVLVVMFVLAIPTGLVLASQNAVPGEATYSIKRKMEDIIVSVASLHPSTRAYFRVDLTNRRLDESVKLLSRQSADLADKTLYEYASQTEAAVAEILLIKDETTRRELAQKLLKELKDQEIKLQKLKTQADGSNIPQAQPTVTPTPVLIQTTTTNSAGQVIVIVITATPAPKPTVTPTPRLSPTPTATAAAPAPAAPAGGGLGAAGAANTGAQGAIADIAASSVTADDNGEPPPPDPTLTPILETGARRPRLNSVIAPTSPTPTLRVTYYNPTSTPAPDRSGTEFTLVGDDLPTPTPVNVVVTQPSNAVGSCTATGTATFSWSAAAKTGQTVTNYTLRINKEPFDVWAPNDGISGDLALQTGSAGTSYGTSLTPGGKYGFSVQAGYSDYSAYDAVSGNEFTCN